MEFANVLSEEIKADTHAAWIANRAYADLLTNMNRNDVAIKGLIFL